MVTTFTVTEATPVNNGLRLKLRGQITNSPAPFTTYVGSYHIGRIKPGDIVTVQSGSMFMDRVVNVQGR